MKIDPKNIQGVGGIGKSSPSQKKEISGDSFDSLLNDAISVKKGDSAEKPSPVATIPDVAPTSIDQNSFVRTSSVAKLEKLFRVMEMYQNALDNPQIGIQRLEGSLEEMISLSREAIDFMAHLPADDELREVISESAATVMTESRLYDTLKRSN